MNKLSLQYDARSQNIGNFSNTQNGVALLVVLMFLILIMIAGAMAVRQSNTDLKTATSDQINTLLLQSSDSSNQKLESMVNSDPSSADYIAMLGATGPFGHFILDPSSKNHEYVYCYNPRNKNYLINNASVMLGTGSYWNSFNKGFCDYTNPDSYTSSRRAVMTQMNIKVNPPSVNAEPFESFTIGKEVNNASSIKYKFDIFSTSMIPSFNKPDITGAKCTEQTSIVDKVTGDKSSLLGCLQKATTPSKMLYEQADVENVSNSTTCVKFGKNNFTTTDDKKAKKLGSKVGTGTGVKNTQCTL